MWQDLIKYRDSLGLDKSVSFGLEIEFVDANRSYVDDDVKRLYDTNKISKPWELVNEETLYDSTLQGYNYYIVTINENELTYAIEPISEIIYNNKVKGS